ncbi:MAG: zinc ribbon domain-containing protein [Chloroflexi bacterium]|nr:zinc ribbon domain-containing protein [Chloroflexota bacterium]
MPTYEYRCESCRHLFTLKQSFTAEGVANCPQCQGQSHRVIRAPVAVIFKGRGWSTYGYEASRDYFGLRQELREVQQRQERKVGSAEWKEDREEQERTKWEGAQESANEREFWRQKAVEFGDMTPEQADAFRETDLTDKPLEKTLDPTKLVNPKGEPIVGPPPP